MKRQCDSCERHKNPQRFDGESTVCRPCAKREQTGADNAREGWIFKPQPARVRREIEYRRQWQAAQDARNEAALAALKAHRENYG